MFLKGCSLCFHAFPSQFDIARFENMLGRDLLKSNQFARFDNREKANLEPFACNL